MRESTEEFQKERFEIRKFGQLFHPGRKQEKTPINLGHKWADRLYSHEITRALLGYANLDSPLKFFFSAWDMIINPEKANENEESIGTLAHILTPFVSLAVLSSLIGKKLYDKGEDNSAFYALYGAFWLVRGPLMLLGLVTNALAVLALYLTIITLAVAFVATGAALLVGLSPIIALGVGIFYAVETSKEPKNQEQESRTELVEEEQREEEEELLLDSERISATS